MTVTHNEENLINSKLEADSLKIPAIGSFGATSYSKFFLATTADRVFWKTEQPVLFLGEWCRLYNETSERKQTRGEVLPYPWDDRARFKFDFETIDVLTEGLLSKLAEALNVIHNARHSLRYWRILLGPWLYYFVPIIYERHLCLKAATPYKDSLETIISNEPDGNQTPNDFRSFVESSVTDRYNLLLYSRILLHEKCFPFTESTPYKKDLTLLKSISRKPFFKSQIKRLNSIARQWVPQALQKVVFVDSSFPKSELFLLQLSMGQCPLPDSFEDNPPPSDFSPSLRAKLQTMLFDRSEEEIGFSKLLRILVAEQLPKCYLEGYKPLLCEAQRTFPRSPSLIVAGTALTTHDTFKAWAASQIERGIRLGIIQHGGHYGTGWCHAERHELRVSDAFFTWGWTNNTPNCVPTAAPKLIGLRKGLHRRKKGKILLVLNSFPRYSYRLFSIPVASQALYFIQDQIEFIGALDPQLQKQLMVRLHPIDHGWNEKKRLLEQFPDLEIVQGGISFKEQLKHSRLCIGTHNTTTYLETLAANYPTLLYWNPKYWELRPEAQRHFDQLREASIFFDTPHKAATQLNQIHDSIEDWWFSERVQTARRQFAQTYCQTNKHWRKQWLKTLKDIYA